MLWTDDYFVEQKRKLCQEVDWVKSKRAMGYSQKRAISNRQKEPLVKKQKDLCHSKQEPTGKKMWPL